MRDTVYCLRCKVHIYIDMYMLLYSFYTINLEKNYNSVVEIDIINTHNDRKIVLTNVMLSLIWHNKWIIYYEMCRWQNCSNNKKCLTWFALYLGYTNRVALVKALNIPAEIACDTYDAYLIRYRDRYCTPCTLRISLVITLRNIIYVKYDLYVSPVRTINPECFDLNYTYNDAMFP